MSNCRTARESLFGGTSSCVRLLLLVWTVAAFVALDTGNVEAQRADERDPAPAREDEPGRVPSTAFPVVERIFVPAGRPELWPEGKWLPVEAGKLLPLLNSRGDRGQRDRTWFSSAIYSATFDPTSRTLVAGTATLVVAPTGARSESSGTVTAAFVPLDPLNLAIQTATWKSDNRRAIVGTSSDEKSFLFTGGRSGELNLQWMKAGQETPLGLEFDVALPRAIVTKLLLKIPPGWTATTAESGLPLLPGDDVQPWSFPLGIRNRVRIRLNPVTTGAPPSTASAIAFQQNTRFTVGQDSHQGHSEFQLTDIGTSATSLPTLLVPDEYRIDSIRDAANRPIPWNPVESSTPGYREARLVPGPVGIPVIERFTLTFSPAQPARPLRSLLKTPRLSQGILLENSRVNVIVAAPLSVSSYEPHGMRLLQTSTPDDDAGGGDFRLTFQHFLLDSSLDLQLSRPGESEASVDVRELVLLQLDQTPPTLIADFQLTSGSREVFDFRALLPREWEINSVQLVNSVRTVQPGSSPDDREISWRIQNSSDSYRQLTVDFADSLPLKRPVTLRIHAELPDAGAGSQIAPVAVPDPAARTELMVAVIASTPDRPTLKSSTFQPLSHQAALQSAGWSTLLSATDEDTRFWSARLWSGFEDALSTRLLVPESAVEPDSNPPEDSVTTGPGIARDVTSGEPSTGNPRSAARPVVTAHLKSRISSGAGRDEHTLTWHFLYSLPAGVFEFSLPKSAMLLTVEWDGERTPVNESRQTCSIPVPGNATRQRLTIRYTLPSADVFLRDTYRAAVPEAELGVAGFRWDVTVSDEISVVSFSDDFSLAAPTGNSGITPDEKPGWLVWFFGPLARPVQQGAFNPLSASSWVSWTSTRPPTAEETSGWKTVTVEAGSIPESFAIHICRTNRLRALAWFVLIISSLVGAILRATQATVRSCVGLVWLTGCMAAAVLVPDTYAELVGAAVLGSFLASAIPRSLIRKKPVEEQLTRAMPSQSMPSTLSMQRIPTALIILGMLGAGCWLAACQAQEPATKTASTIRILIPFDDSNDAAPVATGGVFHVEESTLARLESFLPQREYDPVSLITRADYLGTIDSSGRMKLTADLIVAVRGVQHEITVGIPARFLTGRGECRLDGEPVRLLPDISGRRVIIVFPESNSPDSVIAPPETGAATTAGTVETTPPDKGTATSESVSQSAGAHPVPVPGQDEWHFHTLSFELLPEFITNENSSAIRMPVPRVADNRLLLNFAVPPKSLRVSDAGVSSELLAPRVEWNFAPVSELLVEWSAAGSKPAFTPPEIQCRASAVVYPSWTDRRLSAKYPAGSKSRFLAWRLPSDAVVLKESVSAPGLIAVHVRSNATGKLIVLEVERTSQSFHIEIPWRLPRQTGMPSGFEIERAVDPFHPETVLPISEYFAGLSPALGFYFSATGQVPPAGVAADREEAVSAWQSFWPEAERVRPVELIVSQEKAESLRLDVAPQEPVRSARPTQSLQVERDQVQMRFSAEVRIAQAAAFVHELQIPPRLAIDSVTVLEDDVDRLNHWVRRGPRLFLHLGSGTTGVQNIVLQGRLPIDADGRVSIGEVKVEHARSEETVIQISRPPELTVLVESGLAPAGAVTEPGNPASTQPVNNDVDAVNRLGSRFRFASKSTSAPRSGVIVVTAAAPRDQIQSLTVLRPDTTRSGGIQAEQYVVARSLSASKLSVTFPDWPLAAATVPVASSPDLIGQQFDTVSQTLTVTLSNPVPDPARLKIVAALTRGTEQASLPGEIKPPRQLTPPVIDATRVELFLATSPELESEHEETMRNPLVANGEVSDGLFSQFSSEDSTLLKDTVKWQSPVLFSAPSSVPSNTSEAFVLHALTPGRKNSALGLTRILLASNSEPSLSIDWPEGLTPIAIHVNGRPQQLAEPTNSQLTMPISEETGSQVVELLWRQSQGSRGLKIRRAELRLPAPRIPSVEPVPVLVLPSNGTSVLTAKTDLDDVSTGLLIGSFEEWDVRLPRATNNDILTTRILEALAPTGNTSADPNAEESSAPPAPVDPLSPKARIRSLLAARLQRQMPKSEASRIQIDDFPAGIEGVLQNRNRSASLVTVSQSGPVSLWVIDNRLGEILNSVLAAILLFPMIWILLSLKTGERIAAWPTVSWLLLGLIWWLCLRASPAGLLLTVVSLFRLAMQLRRTIRRAEAAA